MLRRLDDFHFDRWPGFQPISGRVQEWIGVTCFTQGRVLLVLGCAIYMYHNWSAITAGSDVVGHRHELIFFFLFAMFFLYDSYRNESRMAKRKGVMNPMRGRTLDMSVRLAFVAFNFFSLVTVFDGHSVFYLFVPHLLVTISFYLLACTPQPPKPSRLMEWLAGKVATAR